MTPNENLFMMLLGSIGVFLGITMLKAASRQNDPNLAKKYRTRGTIYFVAGAGLLTIVLLRAL